MTLVTKGMGAVLKSIKTLQKSKESIPKGFFNLQL